MPLHLLTAALGLPDGVQIVAIREGSNNIAEIKLAIPDGAMPQHGPDTMVVLDGVANRPKCSFRVVKKPVKKPVQVSL